MNYNSGLMRKIIINQFNLLFIKFEAPNCLANKLANVDHPTLTFFSQWLLRIGTPSRLSTIVSMKQCFIMSYENMKFFFDIENRIYANIYIFSFKSWINRSYLYKMSFY